MYIVRAVLIPGNPMAREGRYRSLKQAREACKKLLSKNALGKPMMPWLRWQDVRIEREDGTLVEYAGPAR